MSTRLGAGIGQITRRVLLGSAAAAAARPALAEGCRFGPAPHAKGPRVFLDYDQVELDAAYTQAVYEPNIGQIVKRLASNSKLARARIEEPQRVAYGTTDIEKLDIYRAKSRNAPVFFYIQGGAWRLGSAASTAYAAEMFVNAGAVFVAPDYVLVQNAGGSLMPMAQQLRRAAAWIYKNATSFGGDPQRIYVAGHSAGGHLAGVVLTTDWGKEFGLPADIIKGGMCMSGMYDLEPVRRSVRRSYVKFDDAMVQALSPQRHIDLLRAPLLVSYGTLETPEFQRQSRDFAAAVRAAGKPVKLLVAESYAHLEMAESLGNPYGANGHAALSMMELVAEAPI
jgi:arylformamidase